MLMTAFLGGASVESAPRFPGGARGCGKDVDPEGAPGGAFPVDPEGERSSFRGAESSRKSIRLSIPEFWPRGWVAPPRGVNFTCPLELAGGLPASTEF